MTFELLNGSELLSLCECMLTSSDGYNHCWTVNEKFLLCSN